MGHTNLYCEVMFPLGAFPNVSSLLYYAYIRMHWRS